MAIPEHTTALDLLKFDDDDAPTPYNAQLTPEERAIQYMDTGDFFAAVRAGNIRLVRCLIDHHTHVEDDNLVSLRRCPHEFATVSFIQFLTGQGNNIRYREHIALMIGAAQGNLEMVQYFIEERSVDVHTADDFALITSAKTGTVEVVRYFIEHGANVMAQNEAALAHAVRRGDEKLIECLLECYSVVDQKFLLLVIQQGNVELLQRLRAYADTVPIDKYLLQYLIMCRKDRMIRYLVKEGFLTCQRILESLTSYTPIFIPPNLYVREHIDDKQVPRFSILALCRNTLGSRAIPSNLTKDVKDLVAFNILARLILKKRFAALRHADHNLINHILSFHALTLV